MYDALIVGAGPAGATAALMLARAGWKVVLAEKSVFPRRKVCGEFVSPAGIEVLHQLGIADAFLALAGPPIRRVALWSGDAALEAPMPGACGNEAYGRALGREHLDTLILDRAARAGARVLQPVKVVAVERQRSGTYLCTLDGEHGEALAARRIIAAHGSWERGGLHTQRARHARRASDLFAFKAHFRGGELDPDLMPLLAFPGGYGGMVQTDCGRISFSCCIRRDALARCRKQYPFGTAGHAISNHIFTHCTAAAHALANAEAENDWLAAGPIEPGIRLSGHDEWFRVGNAAGEAHPIVAEGISMAMQSTVLLCDYLIDRGPLASGAHIARDYAAAWRKNFTARLRAAACYAWIASRPATAACVLETMRRVPALLTWGAQMAGKAQTLQGQPRAASPQPRVRGRPFIRKPRSVTEPVSRSSPK